MKQFEKRIDVLVLAENKISIIFYKTFVLIPKWPKVFEPPSPAGVTAAAPSPKPIPSVSGPTA